MLNRLALEYNEFKYVVNEYTKKNNLDIDISVLYDILSFHLDCCRKYGSDISFLYEYEISIIVFDCFLNYSQYNTSTNIGVTSGIDCLLNEENEIILNEKDDFHGFDLRNKFYDLIFYVDFNLIEEFLLKRMFI